MAKLIQTHILDVPFQRTSALAEWIFHASITFWRHGPELHFPRRTLPRHLQRGVPVLHPGRKYSLLDDLQNVRRISVLRPRDTSSLTWGDSRAFDCGRKQSCVDGVDTVEIH